MLEVVVVVVVVEVEVMELLEGGRNDKFRLTVTNGAGKLNTTSVLIKSSV